VNDITCFVDAVVQFTKVRLVQNIAVNVNFN
jgi:hypothetical protein